MYKLMHTASYVIMLTLALSVICLMMLVVSKEYNKHQFHQCEISFSESMVTVPCEYVDGIVKIRI